jgi:hypothetical protein
MLYYKKASVFLLNLLRLFAFAGSGGRDLRVGLNAISFVPLSLSQKDAASIPHTKNKKELK